MEWSDIGKAIANVAPTVATLFGCPPIIANAAGSLLADFLGVEDTADAIQEAIRDPETLLKLKAFEAEKEKQLMRLSATALQAEMLNTKSAREKEVKMAQAGGFAGSIGALATPVVAIIVCVGFFWMLNCIINQPEGTAKVSEPALLLLGSLGTAFGAVVNYYLGSSLGSYMKDRGAKK